MDILFKYFGMHGYKPKILPEIAIEYGVSSERIRQIKEEALGKLKSFLNPNLLSEYLY